MIDPKLFREQFDVVKKGLLSRGVDLQQIEAYVAIDRQWRDEKIALDELRHKQHEATPKGKPTPELLQGLKTLSEEVKQKQVAFQDLEDTLRKAAMMLPNLPDSTVPVGKDDTENKEVRIVGDIPNFEFKPKSHDELGEDLEILDFGQAASISGARFAVYKGMGARLERGLINFMLDCHTSEHGYTEVLPPVLVATRSMEGTGQLPKFEEDSFKIDDTDLWLSPTAEVQLTNLYRDSIVEEADLPIKITAGTPCFRKEAGSYGKDMKGLIRLHQFNKVELVSFCKPEDSFEMLESLTEHAETILKKLELPYRVVSLCTGDIGFASTKTYDLEVWFPSQNCYREISSCSNFLDFQSRRAMIRYKDSNDSKTKYLHTLNGSGLAVGRTLAALLENNQNQDGTVTLPQMLEGYVGERTIACKVITKNT